MTNDIDPYWNYNNILAEGMIHGEQSLIRLRMHRSEETYEHSINELFPLTSRRGNRVYFHAKPYILVPDITLTFALSPKPAPDGAIGTVINSNVKKLKPREIGNAQAWYYPAEQALVLWECFLEEPYRTTTDPTADTLLNRIWEGFEQTLLEQVGDVERIFTTYEPIYERPVYEQFLIAQGFTQCGPVAFVKKVPKHRHAAA